MTRSRREFPEPVLVISQCLEFEPCRYDGAMIRSDFVKALAPHVRYRPVCPEVEVGLGIPRDPIRLVASGDRNRLVQPRTGRDLTDDMEAFADRFLGRLDGVDGFILKSKSPSCGPDMVKVFDGTESPAVVRRGAGLFAAAGVVGAYLEPVAFIPSGKISFQAAMNRFISSSVPTETLR